MVKQRILSVGERIMHVHQNETINCLFTVRVKGNLSVEQIAYALLKLQEKHPLLRSVIKEVDRQCFFVLQDDMRPIPVEVYDRQTDDDWERLTRDHWQIHLDVSRGPLAKMLWLKGVGVSELILICPHCIADGVSMTTLLREFLLVLDNPDYDIGNPQPFMEEIRSPHLPSVPKQLRTKFKGFIGACFAKILLPGKRKQGKLINLNESYMLRYRFTVLDTEYLLNDCKKHGVSLYAFMSALFLDEFKKVFSGSAKQKLICPVDIRKYLTTLKEDQLFAFAPIIDVKTIKNSASDVWQTAGEIKKEMMLKLSNIDIGEIIYMNNRFLSFVPKLLNHLHTDIGNHDFTFSNMGNLKLPPQFKTFIVEEVYSPSVAFPWRNPNTMVMSSYKGVLDLTFISNNAILKKEAAALFMEQSVQKIKDLINDEHRAPAFTS